MENQNIQNQPQQQEEDAAEDQHETFTCEICIEPMILPNGKFKNSNKCIHPFCTDCIHKYIKLKVEENVSDIKCPAINCNHSLEISSCRLKITKQVFNRWCDALCESLVLGFSRVYSPNTNCSELILDECGDDFDGGLKRRECPKCRKPFCLRCKSPWHAADHSCGETMDENEAAFVRVFKKNGWKRCPNCRHCIERVDGCSKVKCRCGVVFDYNSGIISRSHNVLVFLLPCGSFFYVVFLITILVLFIRKIVDAPSPL